MKYLCSLLLQLSTAAAASLARTVTTSTPTTISDGPISEIVLGVDASVRLTAAEEQNEAANVLWPRVQDFVTTFVMRRFGISPTTCCWGRRHIWKQNCRAGGAAGRFIRPYEAISTFILQAVVQASTEATTPAWAGGEGMGEGDGGAPSGPEGAPFQKDIESMRAYLKTEEGMEMRDYLKTPQFLHDYLKTPELTPEWKMWFEIHVRDYLQTKERQILFLRENERGLPQHLLSHKNLTNLEKRVLAPLSRFVEKEWGFSVAEPEAQPATEAALCLCVHYTEEVCKAGIHPVHFLDIGGSDGQMAEWVAEKMSESPEFRAHSCSSRHVSFAADVGVSGASVERVDFEGTTFGGVVDFNPEEDEDTAGPGEEAPPRSRTALQRAVRHALREVLAGTSGPPDEDGLFGVIHMRHTLHHVPGLSAQDDLLRQVYELLRPGGFLVLIEHDADSPGMHQWLVLVHMLFSHMYGTRADFNHGDFRPIDCDHNHNPSCWRTGWKQVVETVRLEVEENVDKKLFDFVPLASLPDGPLRDTWTAGDRPHDLWKEAALIFKKHDSGPPGGQRRRQPQVAIESGRCTQVIESGRCTIA